MVGDWLSCGTRVQWLAHARQLRQGVQPQLACCMRAGEALPVRVRGECGPADELRQRAGEDRRGRGHRQAMARAGLHPRGAHHGPSPRR